ncbi:MAG: hypothetical protein IH609_20365 [Dehalococcoidia bacterium]|nr:hypothetical protein [Dehalococcoidia bacterium]
MNVWSDSLRPGGLVGVLVGAVLAAAAVGVARAETPVPSPTPTPSVTAPPSPAGTPWPAPTGVTVRVEAILLDANNFPLPPEKQVHTAVVTWELMNGFTGTYEIEHGIAAIRSSAPRKWQLAGTVDANAAVDGTLRWEEQVQPLSLNYCYRVRTVIASAPGPETGPYSAEACIPEPPSSGPAPLPPAVGNSAGTAPGSGSLPPAWFAFAAAVFAGGPLVAGWAALRKRRG